MAKLLDTKICSVCGVHKPATREYFRYYTMSKGGKSRQSHVCRTCEEQVGLQQTQAQLDRQAKEEIRSEIGLLDSQKNAMLMIQDMAIKLMQEAAGSKANIPHTSEFLEQFMSMIGGVGNYTKLLIMDMMHAAPGSQRRANFHKMVASLITKNTEQGGARKPVELMSDTEIDEEVTRLLQQRSEPQLRLTSDEQATG